MFRFWYFALVLSLTVLFLGDSVPKDKGKPAVTVPGAETHSECCGGPRPQCPPICGDEG